MRTLRDTSASRILAVLLAGWVLLGGPGSVGEASPVLTQPDDAEVQPPGEQTTVRGRLAVAGEPLQGVVLEAFSDNQRVGRATTDADGSWEIELPGEGTFTITLDADTLPEEVALRDPERASNDVTIREGQQRFLLFPLGEGEGTAARLFGRLAQASMNGVKFGLIIAMTAIGLSLVYGTTRMVNFAHGDMVTFGAVMALYLNTSGPRLQLIPAAVVAVAIGGAFGAGLERGLWRPLRRRRVGIIQLLVISIGLALVIRHLILLRIGGRTRSFVDYTVQQPLRLGPVLTTPRDLIVILLSALILGAVGLFLLRTRTGKAMRAVSDNRDLAESSGIDVQRVILFVWIMSGSLAALGGVLLGVVETVDFLMGFRALLLMFAAVILGGLGTAFGAMAGGIVVGIATEVSTIFQPAELKSMWALIALIVVLMFRPQGLFGRRERIG